MLHEVLLALSGHPSPLLNQEWLSDDTQSTAVNRDFADITPSEASLLESLGQLALLHQRLRDHLQLIIPTHHSIVCRAAAASILNTHLGRFQKRILDVESQILSRDPAVVGAYNIVPLSSIVNAFEEWSRLISWYWKTASFIRRSRPAAQKSTRDGKQQDSLEASGAAIVDYLRQEAHTGYSDIECAAVELSKVAETAWLRQLCSWVLRGQLPQFAPQDFCIRNSDGSSASFTVNKACLPAFVTPQTAGSLLFIGKCLYQLKNHHVSVEKRQGLDDSLGASLSNAHLRLLSDLSLPVSSSTFSRTITTIRTSLSQNVLKHLLPESDIVQVLLILRDFFLLGRGEFAITLIAEADERMNERQQAMGRYLQEGLLTDVRGAIIREGEIAEALARTWKVLLAAEDDSGGQNDIEPARDAVQLVLASPSRPQPASADSTSTTLPSLSSVSFNDVLFPTATQLTLIPRSPLDLFLTPSVVECYSQMNAFLLAIRKAHLRLSNLWRLSPARRDLSRKARSAATKQRDAERNLSMRKVWATCSSAIFLLSETSAYFEGEIIKGSWDHFFQWATGRAAPGSSSRPSSKAGGGKTDTRTLSTSVQNLSMSSSPTQSIPQPTTEAEIHHDPETLAQNHRAFLSHLIYALLLTDHAYTRDLRTLISDVENLTALFARLIALLQTINTGQEDERGGVEGSGREEAKELSLHLDRARKRVDSDMKSLVRRLRQLDQERVGGGSHSYADVIGTGGSNGGMEGMEGSAFVPWKGGGVDRLLMKLDFGRGGDEGEGEL